MNKKLIIVILIYTSLLFSNNTDNDYAILTHDERMEISKFCIEHSLNTANQIYKFCFDAKKDSNVSSENMKIKLRGLISHNMTTLEQKYPNHIMKHVKSNPDAPESKFIKRSIEMAAVYLLGGTICRCCIPVKKLIEETNYVLTGNELDQNSPLKQMDYEEFQDWSKNETDKFEQKLREFSN